MMKHRERVKNSKKDEYYAIINPVLHHFHFVGVVQYAKWPDQVSTAVKMLIQNWLPSMHNVYIQHQVAMVRVNEIAIRIG